ncbi:hypothetical protein D3C76_1157420 [compost metagenome]
MPGFPARIAEGDQALFRPAAIGDGEQHILGSGQRQAVQLDGGLEALVTGVQDKAAIALYRAAHIDRYVHATGRRFDVRAQLFEDIGQVELLGPIDHQPHRAIGVVLDDVGQGLREVRVGHVWHGDQELVLEVIRAEVLHG